MMDGKATSDDKQVRLTVAAIEEDIWLKTPHHQSHGSD